MMIENEKTEISTPEITGVPLKKNDVNEMSYFIEKYQICPEDSIDVRNILYPIVKDKIGDMIEDFYVWLEVLPEYNLFFKDNDKLLMRVKAEQAKYWDELLSSDMDNIFYQKRVSLATTHARINLPLDSYFSGLAYFMNWIISTTMNSVLDKDAKAGADKKEQMFKATASFVKILQIDQAIVVDNYVKTTNAKLNELVNRQANTITKLATPIALLAKDILLVSIIGVIDSKRAQEIMETTLTKIVDTTSRVAIVDIAGVDMVDTSVANHLIKMTQAIKLMGCTCILSGVSPAIAQTVIQLGVDLRDLTTKAVLKDAVEMAIRLVDKQTKEVFL